MVDEIRSLDFAITDLTLYLDTHPDDRRALCLYRKYTKEAYDLKNQYQKVYGPLTTNFPCNKWRWLEEPWPWERGNF
jgi:spore coat protein JB